MKRILTIGRDYSCDIHINDGADIVSRNHATLEIGIGGKYYITDTSSNGTYVNGMRIPYQQRFEITREDEVSFAHAAILEWNTVPRDKTIMIAVIGVVAAIVVAVAIALAVTGSKSGGYDGDDYAPYVYTPVRTGARTGGSNTPEPVEKTPEKTTPKEAEKEEKKTKKSKKPATKKEKGAAQEKNETVLDPIY